MTGNDNRNEGFDKADDEAQRWVVRLMAGDMTEEEMEQFVKWLQTSPRNKEAFEEVRDLWSDVKGLKDIFDPDDDEPPSRGSGSSGSGGLQFSSFTIIMEFLKRQRDAIAGIAVAAIILIAVYAGDISVWLYADHITRQGEQTSITLADGSLAHLNTGSAIAIDYTSLERNISLLRGEVLFEVRKNTDRPFIVTARDRQVTAVGTAFVVRDRADKTVVTVASGTVSLGQRSTNEVLSHEKLMLNARERTSYRKKTAPTAIEAIDPKLIAAWRNGTIIMDNLPLSEAIAELDRYLPGRILLVGKVSDFEPVTAKFSIADLDAGIDALAATHGLSVTRLTDYLLVVR